MPPTAASPAGVAAGKDAPSSATKRGTSASDVIELDTDGKVVGGGSAAPGSNKKAKVAEVAEVAPSQVSSAPAVPALKKMSTSSTLVAGGAAPVSIGAFFGESSSSSSSSKRAISSPPIVKVKAESTVQAEPSSNKKQKLAVRSPPPSSTKKSAGASKDDDDDDEELLEPSSSTLAAGVFDGKRLAVTGEFSINGHSRSSIEELIKEHGGKVASNVSGKTNFLIVGDCDLNQSDKVVTSSGKYKDAVSKNVKILTAQEFLQMIPAPPPPQQQHAGEAAAKEPHWQTSFRQTVPSLNPPGAAGAGSSASVKPPAASFSGSLPALSSTVAAFKPRPVTAPSSSSSSLKSSSSSSNVNVDDLMWVDKHKPKQLSDIIGHPDIVKSVKNWLETWEAVHIAKTKKVEYKKENPGAKAMLISGPPGIGKTTMATLIGSSLGYEVLELNASDTRNKRAISEELADVVQSKAIGFGGKVNKRMIIMDEVDGMGGSDRGGIPELIKVIKSSKTPIICICNDRHSVKIKSLAGHCFDIKVKRPVKQLVAKKLVEIALREGLQVEINAAEMLVEQSGNDIRQALHAMQMWRAQATSMKYSDLRNRMGSIEKDKVLRQSFFEATLEILKGGGPNRNMPSFDERYNSFFVDYSLIPLMVQQNYVKAYVGGGVCKAANDADKMTLLAKAADAVADMELAEAGIRGMDQHWELLPVCAAFTLRVGSLIQGYQGFPDFSAWMGKNSSKGRKHRLTQELSLHSMLATGQGFGATRLEYAPYLRSFLLAPLVQRGQGGIAEVIKLLDDYGLSKDDFSDSLKDLSIPLPSSTKPVDPFEALDPTLKTALTKAYNNSGHRAQALVHAEGVSKKSKRTTVSKDEFGEYDAEDMDGIVGDDELAAVKDETKDEDVGDVSAFVKQLKKTKAAEKKAAKKPPAAKKK